MTIDNQKKSYPSEHHSFDIEIASSYGIECAILIHHFAHWIKINAKLKRNFHEGRYWTYQTLDEITAHFPYWTRSQVQNYIEMLCTGRSRFSTKESPKFNPILLKGNFNATPYDRTIWYSFSDNYSSILCTHKMENKDPLNHDSDDTTPIPDTIPDTKTYRGEPSQKIKCNPKKKEVTQPTDEILTFGDYVKLKRKSYEDLIGEYGAGNIEYYINAINNWVPNNRAYKDYAAAIRQWLLKDQKDGKFKISTKCVSASGISQIEENKRYAEKVERHLAPKSNCYVYFNASPTEFVHFNSNKDIQEKLSYDCSREEFKEKLVRSLGRSIPDIKNILYPQATNKMVGISQLVQQCKVN